MCLIAFALDAHPSARLLVAANRDEFWDRPTLPLQRWHLSNGVAVHAGRDLRAGGTWMGFTPGGRVGMLTNVRSGAPDVAPHSRGELVTRWLGADGGWADWLDSLDPAHYGGFNAVLGDLKSGEWVWLSNRPASGEAAAGAPLALPPGWHGRRLGAGVYALSNAALDTPWPKALALKQALAGALPHWHTGADDHPGRQALLAALTDMRQAPAEALPETGVPADLERELSSAFVHAPQRGYGTRSSLIGHWNGEQLGLEEWTHPPQPHDGPAWPLARSAYRRISISMCGMPTSS